MMDTFAFMNMNMKTYRNLDDPSDSIEQYPHIYKRRTPKYNIDPLYFTKDVYSNGNWVEPQKIHPFIDTQEISRLIWHDKNGKPLGASIEAGVAYTIKAPLSIYYGENQYEKQLEYRKRFLNEWQKQGENNGRNGNH